MEMDGIFKSRLTPLQNSTNIRNVLCGNANCRNVRLQAEELVEPPDHALVYFGIERKRQRKMCSSCVNEANRFAKRAKKEIKEGGNLFSLRIQVQPERMEPAVKRKSDDAGCVDKENTPCYVPGHSDEPVYYLCPRDLEAEITKIMDKYRIKEQVKRCVTTVSKEADILGAEFGALEKQMEENHSKLAELINRYNEWSKPFQSTELGTIDIRQDGSCTMIESANLDEQIKAAVNYEELSETVREFRHSIAANKIENQLRVQSKKQEIKNPKLGDTFKAPPSPKIGFLGRQRLIFAPPKLYQSVFAMFTDLLTSWATGQIVNIINSGPGKDDQMYRVKPHDPDQELKISLFYGNQIAFMKPMMTTKLPVGTRIIAKFTDTVGSNPESHGLFFAGIVAEIYSEINKNRYLIFFDDGYTQYVDAKDVLPVVNSKKNVWEEVYEDNRSFIQSYLAEFPHRAMLKAKVGNRFSVNLNGTLERVQVEEIDCSLMKVKYLTLTDNYSEWIYRGSLRLQPLKGSVRSNNVMQKEKGALTISKKIKQSEMYYEVSGTTTKINIPFDCPIPKPFVPHECSLTCAYRYDEQRFKEVSPLVIPFHLGWARELPALGKKDVAYITPCGVRLTTYQSICLYISKTASGIPIEFFSLNASIDCLNEFHPVRKLRFLRDISYGKEWTPVQCVNSIDQDIPEHLDYHSERVLGEGVKINDEKGFLTCCDCEDGCMDKSKCACWQLTLNGMTFQEDRRLEGYVNRRLPEIVLSGIFECNDGCHCKMQTCTNRVVQSKLKWPLQLFKTIKKGWGIRTLHDIPKGSFISVYSGRILNSAQADAEGREYGDEYIADMDLIEAMECIKEGYEPDCPDISEFELFETLTNEQSPSLKESWTKAGMQVARKSTSGGVRRTSACATRTLSQELSPISNGLGKPLRYRRYFSELGQPEKPYSIDGKRQGNIGRYFNHSCDPNLFIQNVFVDTHDLRFPWLAFFTNKDVKAGTELCWDYRYEVGSVPDKRLDCYCNSKDCRKVLL